MQVIILTDCQDLQPILNALSAGTNGRFPKQTPPGELLHAIREVHQGEAKIVELARRPPRLGSESANLTLRQTQALDLLAQGCSYQEIARTMRLTYATAHTHIRHLYKKLGVRSRAQAVAKYGANAIL